MQAQRRSAARGKPGLTPDTPLGECPTVYLQRNTLERRIWDLLSVLGEMRKNPQWDGRLALVGGSEGAMLAGLTAPLIPGTRAVALISGGGGDTFAEEVTQMMRDQGAGEKQLGEFRQLCEQVHQQPTTTREWGSDGKMARNTHLWLSRAEDLAIYRPLLRVQAPILIVHGAADKSTPVHSAEKLQEIFQQAGHTNLQLRIEKRMGTARRLSRWTPPWTGSSISSRTMPVAPRLRRSAAAWPLRVVFPSVPKALSARPPDVWE